MRWREDWVSPSDSTCHSRQSFLLPHPPLPKSNAAGYNRERQHGVSRPLDRLLGRFRPVRTRGTPKPWVHTDLNAVLDPPDSHEVLRQPHVPAPLGRILAQFAVSLPWIHNPDGRAAL